MRSETDIQNSATKKDNWVNGYLVVGNHIFIEIDGNDHGWAGISLTKDQARKFARQMLEMVGEE